MRNMNMDGLRGLAAFAVAIGHSVTHASGIPVLAKLYSDLPSSTPSEIFMRLLHVIFNADSAVVVFFVLSGYVLGCSLQRLSDSAEVEFIPYATKRILRLYPVAIIAAIPFYFLQNMSVDELLGTMLLVSNKTNGVIWTLQVELFGSLLIFVLWACRLKHAAIIVAGAFIVAAAIFPPNQYLKYSPAFAIGYLLMYARPIFIYSPRTIFAIGLLMLLVADIFVGKGTAAARYFALSGSALAVGALTCCSFNILNTSSVQFLGSISYPFYLFHPAAMEAAKPIIYGYIHPSAQLYAFIWMTIISIPLAMICSWYVHRCVETPFIIIGSRSAKWIKEAVTGARANAS